MIVQKWELANKIKKLRAVVPKQASTPILQNILVENGKLTATNLELTVSTTLEGSRGEKMLIPAKAFGLIDQLPNGEVEIKKNAGNDRITIRAGDSIRNAFATMNPDEFPKGDIFGPGDLETSIDGENLVAALRNVLYAVPRTSAKQEMTAVCMECDGDELSFVGLNGSQVAWFTIPYRDSFKMLIPRSAAEQLISLGLEGPVQITYGKLTASFSTEEYIVQTRLIDGNYFQYRKPFALQGDRVELPRQTFLNAVKRADMCNDESNPKPVRIDVEADNMRIYIQSSAAAYSETIPLEKDTGQKMTIGFNPALIRTTLESFPDENVQVLFLSPKAPMIITSEAHSLKGLLLPVVVR